MFDFTFNKGVMRIEDSPLNGSFEDLALTKGMTSLPRGLKGSRFHVISFSYDINNGNWSFWTGKNKLTKYDTSGGNDLAALVREHNASRGGQEKVTDEKLPEQLQEHQ